MCWYSTCCQVAAANGNATKQPAGGRPSAQAGKRPRIEQALSLASMPTLLLNVCSARPLEALELLDRNLPRDEASLREWRHSARVAAVMGSCPRSKESFKSGSCCSHACAVMLRMGMLLSVVSGVRHWMRYIEVTHGEKRGYCSAAFPPDLLDILAVSG